MNGINLPEFAAVCTAIAGLIGGIFLYTNRQGDARDKAHEGRISDLQKSLDAVREDCDARIEANEKAHSERIAQLVRDFDRQLVDVKQAMAHQNQIIERQEIMLSDYSRHVSKLERLMAAAGMEIPDFETSALRRGSNA